MTGLECHIWKFMSTCRGRTTRGKVFRAEVATGPTIVYSNDIAIGLLSSLPGSIAFIDSAEVPGNLKILQIDGKLPGQQGYPLPEGSRDQQEEDRYDRTSMAILLPQKSPAISMKCCQSQSSVRVQPTIVRPEVHPTGLSI